MSCTKCKSTPCGCSDHGLITPCEPAPDCSPGVETCDEITCAHCVSYCNDTFQISDPANGDILFEITSGDRLDAILQKMALWMTQNGTPDCSTLIDNHAPLYVNVTNVTNTSAIVSWIGEAPDSLSFQVEYKLVTNPATILWTLSSTIGLGVGTGTITGLVPATQYLIRVGSVGPSQDCESVEILIETLI